MLTEIATNVGQTFLGMTVNCARCHNHKFDPDPAGGLLSPAGGFRGRERQRRRDRHAAEKKPQWEATKAYKKRLEPIEKR